MQKIAIIDMGTNTFHLLVAEIVAGKFKILVRDRVAARIGVGGINQGMITAAATMRAVDTLRAFKIKVDQMHVDEVLAFGTSAIRSAINGQEVVSKIQEVTGIKTQIISGDEEASYIYEGVNLALNLGEEKSLIVDIGGGSVEFIIANGTNIFWKRSFEIGGQRLLEQFQKHDPILPSEITAINDYFEQCLQPWRDAMEVHAPEILVGSSGTFDTLSDIYCNQLGQALVDAPETPFSLAAFEAIYQQLISKNRSERMQIPGMIELRVDMIVVACCLIQFMLTRFTFSQIRVSSYSLKEGVLASMIR